MFKAIDRWLAGYFKSVIKRNKIQAKPCHIMFCIADHFEPYAHEANKDEAHKRVYRFVENYPMIFKSLKDSDGRSPLHTFFYPIEQYDPEILNVLKSFTTGGMGEVEVHLHHRDDTSENMTKTIVEFKEKLRNRHGLLGEDRDGKIRYGFIHGNWALCNSLPDGDWCGVNNEIEVLCRTGCYADFTFPSAPSPTQPGMVNVIYRAGGSKEKPRSHDSGTIVMKNKKSERENKLMIIEGPLAINWRKRKYGVIPSIENSTIDSGNLPAKDRVDIWVRQRISVAGKGDWIFIKVHTHGALPINMDVLLGERMKEMHSYLLEKYNDRENWFLHYVTAREMYNIIRAAEDGMEGSPALYRDYEVKPPPCI